MHAYIHPMDRASGPIYDEIATFSTDMANVVNMNQKCNVADRVDHKRSFQSF